MAHSVSGAKEVMHVGQSEGKHVFYLLHITILETGFKVTAPFVIPRP